jgi:hypothetical protein
MGCAHRVDVEALHEDEVLPHGGDVHRPPGAGVVHVAVHGVQLHGSAVQEERLVTDLHLTESHLRAEHLDYVPVRIQQLEHQAVEVGVFGRPEAGSYNWLGEADRHGTTRGN